MVKEKKAEVPKKAQSTRVQKKEALKRNIGPALKAVVAFNAKPSQ